MQLPASRVGTRHIPQESHAVFGRPIAGSHHLTVSTWRGTAVDASNRSCSVFSSVVCDVQAGGGFAVGCGVSFDEYDLGDLPVLAEVFV